MHKRNYYAKIALQKNSKNTLNIGWCQSDCWLLNCMLLLFLLLLSCCCRYFNQKSVILLSILRCVFVHIENKHIRPKTECRAINCCECKKHYLVGGVCCRGQTTLYQLTVIILLLLFKSVRFCWTMSTTQTFALLLAARSLVVVVVWSSEWVFGEWVCVCRWGGALLLF